MHRNAIQYKDGKYIRVSKPTNAALKVLVCNESSIKYKDRKYVRVSEPTKAALKVLVEEIDLSNNVPEQFRLIKGRKTSPKKYVSFCIEYWKSQFTVLAILEFNHILCKPKDSTQSNILLVKGAPEGILE